MADNQQEESVFRVRLDDLTTDPSNVRTHGERNLETIKGSLRRFGQQHPLVVDSNNVVVAGNGRLEAMRSEGWEDCLVIRTKLDAADRTAFAIADNRTSELAEWDTEGLAQALEGLGLLDEDLLAAAGFDDVEMAEVIEGLGEEERAPLSNQTLAERFMLAPFSVLNAREGSWQDRKRAWIDIGIQSELGRGEGEFHAAPGGSPMVSGYTADGERQTGTVGTGTMNIPLSGRIPDYYWQKEKAEKKLGHKLSNKQFEEKHIVIPPGGGLTSSGTSVFDPVVCELMYRWFTAPGATILDPFAGGSVRGVVAAHLGREYVGQELRGEQVDANRSQWIGISEDKDYDHPPTWIKGDSMNIDKTCADVDADFVFSCPPYADLEVYSDDPADISTMDYDDFLATYRAIIQKSCDRLGDNRFACFVVGEVRDKKGAYRNFIGDTVEAFRRAGLSFYNEIILVTCVGSLPIRMGRQFQTGRKVGKTHQNILVFVKGDGKKASRWADPGLSHDEVAAAIKASKESQDQEEV